MRIRKRSQSVAPPAATLPQPLSYKYQSKDSFMPGSGVKVRVAPSPAAVCSNMQERNRCLVDDEEPPASPRSVSVVYAESLVMESRRHSDADEKGDSDGDLTSPMKPEPVVDKARRKQSPTKRRKIEHESNLVFEGSSSMTAAELLVVNELANGVRQRLAASEHSTTEQATKILPSKPVENSKDALISSIFYVFDKCGENGLSASEVVKYMLDQRLPGLKEGGARHTVQVANVLRSSSSFISLGNKKYLLCATLDVRADSKTPTKTRTPKTSSSGSGANDAKDSSENDDESVLHAAKLRRKSVTVPEKAAHSNTRSGKKVQAEKPKPNNFVQAHPLQELERQASDGEVVMAEPVVVRTTRRRGPSSSQKGKGPTQCKRYDGRGWQCSRLTEPGYSLCVHHQDLINKRAAKLKEQQTLNRLLESVNRKAKSQAPAASFKDAEMDDEVAKSARRESRERDYKDNIPNAPPVQKRKMLSLLAFK